jgi:hypothetical protein
MGIPVGDLSPRGTGMRKKCSPQAFVGIPAGKFFRRRDRDGELFPGGEFPVAIPISSGKKTIVQHLAIARESKILDLQVLVHLTNFSFG